MPNRPKQKTQIAPRFGGIGYILGGVGQYIPPYNLDGNTWRKLAYCQPVVMDCITTLIMTVQALPWDIRAKDPNKQDELKESVEYHKDIINDCNGVGYLNHISLLLSDFYMLPFGGAAETLRYSDGELYNLINIDGATLFPTTNKEFPVVQQYETKTTTYAKNEIARIYQSPRPEIERYGWGMTPIEKIYLAVDMLSKGDKYYAGLLLDTPEAGLLDLGDMSRESAEKWLDSFRTLMTGIDGFKIPVLFEHTTNAKWIPFGRPPTDMLFDQITYKYAQLVCAAFGLTVGDIGLKNSNGSLSSDIRDERHSKSTGFASVKSYLLQYFRKILPKDLIFSFSDTDDELLVSKGRARAANAVAGRNLIESGAISPTEWRQQLKADALITIPLTEEVDESSFDIIKEIDGTNDQLALQEEQLKLQKEQIKANKNTLRKPNGQGGTGLNKQRNVRGGKLQNIQGKEPTPASQGGQGEIKSVYKSSLSDYLTEEFSKVKSKLNKPRTRKLIKFAIENIKPVAKSILDVDDYLDYLFEIKKDEIISKSINDNLQTLSKNLNNDKFWYIDLDDTTLGDILVDYYIKGLESAAEKIQQVLYEEGVTNELEIKYSPKVSDKKLDEIYDYALILLNLINNGTDYYVQRIAVASVLDTLKDFESVDSEEFINTAASKLDKNLQDILDNRVNIISDFEINKMVQRGELEQYKHVGYKEKRLIHIGNDIPCEHCQSQEALGYVPMDYQFVTKMGDTTPFGLLHLNCHHQLQFRTKNLKDIKTNYL